jgi:hypothetical protein
MAEAEQALAATITAAKQAKTLKEACSGLAALEKKIDVLQHVMPPAGFERPFSESRNGISMVLDVMRDQRCSDGSGADADIIRDGLDDLRREFGKLQQIGSKADDVTSPGQLAGGKTDDRLNALDHALTAAAANAKGAKTLNEACSKLGPLGKAVAELNAVAPPKGLEHEFSSARISLSMTFDEVRDQDCAEGSPADAKFIGDEIERMRTSFAELKKLGAK